MAIALRPEDRSAPMPPSAAASALLHGALLESRQRWQDLAGLAADFVFETDAAGRFSFLWPDQVLGHVSARLLGRRAVSLVLGTATDPFAQRRAVRNQRIWMASAVGQPRCLSLSLVPIDDAQGQFAGLRGAARDVTEEETASIAAADGLRRAALLDTLGEIIRHATTAQEALTSGLAGLRDALGCAGTAMVAPGAEGPEVIAPTAPVPAGLTDAATEVLGAARDWTGLVAGRGPAVLLHNHSPTPRQSALAAWRAPGGRGWDAEDLALLRAMAATLGAVLAFCGMQAELERQATTDALTGLGNRRAFLASLADAIGRDGGAGALLFIDLDNLKPLNDRLGHEAGDTALRLTARLIRDAAGREGLAARFGGDEFTMWLPGASEAEAIAQAEHLIAAADALPPDQPAPRFSIGIASRPAGTAEAPALLLARADAALYEAKRLGRNGWRVAKPGP